MLFIFTFLLHVWDSQSWSWQDFFGLYWTLKIIRTLKLIIKCEICCKIIYLPMVSNLLDFHENITFSKTLGKYQHHCYRLQKLFLILYFLIDLKKCIMYVIFSRNITVFNIPGILVQNIPRKFIWSFSRILWEYPFGMFNEYSTNMYLPGGNNGTIEQVYLKAPTYNNEKKLKNKTSRKSK